MLSNSYINVSLLLLLFGICVLSFVDLCSILSLYLLHKYHHMNMNTFYTINYSQCTHYLFNVLIVWITDGFCELYGSVDCGKPIRPMPCHCNILRKVCGDWFLLSVIHSVEIEEVVTFTSNTTTRLVTSQPFD